MIRKLQQQRDHQRKSYVITFPSDLQEERALAWLRSISGSLQAGLGRLLVMPSIVFEVHATDRGITHRVRVPWQEADFIVSQMRSLIPGISVVPDEEPVRTTWSAVAEIGMTAPSRTIGVVNSKDVNASLLTSMQPLNPGESVSLQWVLSPASPTRPPLKSSGSKSDSFSIMGALLGNTSAADDEIDDRRKKLDAPNFLAIGRIAASAETEPRTRHLLSRVERSLASLRSATNSFTRESSFMGSPVERFMRATTPQLFPAQFSIKELVGVMAWPIGQPFVPGLARGASRHLFAGEDISRTGRIIGHSNFPGHERPIALAFDRAVEHSYYGGTIGSGKSTAMANSFAQDVAAGYGAIVIDAGNSESHESLFFRALNYVPPERLDDVIVMDVNRDSLLPVGFNVLDQGNPRVVVDQITDLFGHLYKDMSGVWMRELLFHGLYTLANHGGYSLLDLPKLVDPQTPDERAWADELIRGVEDRELVVFWDRWQQMGVEGRKKAVEPLLNRFWQISARPEIRNIIGQTKSAFTWAEALASNKIVLVSLVGLPKDTASIIGTLIVTTLWSAAQSAVPDKANYLYLDEFQVMTRLPMGLEDMLRQARRNKLGVTLGTQYIDDLSMDMKNAIINAVRSRIIFSTSSREARMWQGEFGRQFLDETDIMHLGRYEGIAQLSTDAGVSRPVSFKALAPLEATGMARQALAISSEKYGKSVRDVEQEMTGRRKPTKETKKRPPIGGVAWDQQ